MRSNKRLAASRGRFGGSRASLAVTTLAAQRNRRDVRRQPKASDEVSARIDPIDVVVSDDSLIAIAILELDGNDRLPNTFGDRAFYYRIRQQPRGPDSRVGVEVNEWLLKLLTGRSGTGDLASLDAFCRLILADGLAAQGLFPHTPSGVGAHHINGRAY